MLWRTQARAIGSFALLWAGACGIVGLGIVLRPLVLYPSLIRAESIVDGLRYVGAWMGIGAFCGAGFAFSVLTFAKRQSIARLAAIPVIASVAGLAFLIGALTDGSKAATGLALVAAALAATTLWLASRPADVGQAPAERAT